MKSSSILLFIMGFSFNLFSQNALPVISVTKAVLDLPGIIIMDYKIEDIDSENFEVSLMVSYDNGLTYNSIEEEDIFGDYGLVSTTGDKTFTMTYLPQGFEKYKLVVSDLYEVNIQDVVNSVDSTTVKTYMQALEGVRHWQANPLHLAETRMLVLDHLSTMGADTSIQIFDNSTPADGINLFGIKSGSTSDLREYLVGGHYDSVEDSPGADDNASAVAGMMEIARVFQNYSFEKPIRFVSWDLEEAGLLGSSYFVNNIDPLLDIQAYLNFEMIGYYTEKPNTQSFPTGFELVFPEAAAEVAEDDYRGNFLTNVGNTTNSFSLMQSFNSHASTYVPELKVLDVASPGNGLAVPDLLRSDHAAFWINGIPAVMLTDASEFRNPNYHTPLDVLDSLDLQFMTNNIKAAVAYLAEEAVIQHKAIVNVEMDFESSINQIDLARKIRIYPLPANEVLTIDFEDIITQDIAWKMYNITGQLLKDGIFVAGKSKFLVDIQDIVAGDYLINFKLGTKDITRKIQVQVNK